MDAGSWCGKGFQIPERSGSTEPFFLCASAPEFLGWGGLVYSDATDRGNDGGGAGPRGARAGRESCAVRDDYAAGTIGSLDIAAASGGNFSSDLRCIGAAARGHRTVWRDVICGVAEYPRVGAAHGAWRGRIQSLAAGDVAWPGIDRRRRLAGRRGGTGINEIAWKPPVQGESTRPAGLRVRIRGDDYCLPGSVSLARLARNPNRSSPRVAGLILYNPLSGSIGEICPAMMRSSRELRVGPGFAECQRTWMEWTVPSRFGGATSGSIRGGQYAGLFPAILYFKFARREECPSFRDRAIHSSHDCPLPPPLPRSNSEWPTAREVPGSQGVAHLSPRSDSIARRCKRQKREFYAIDIRFPASRMVVRNQV